MSKLKLGKLIWISWELQLVTKINNLLHYHHSWQGNTQLPWSQHKMQRWLQFSNIIDINILSAAVKWSPTITIQCHQGHTSWLVWTLIQGYFFNFYLFFTWNRVLCIPDWLPTICVVKNHLKQNTWPSNLRKERLILFILSQQGRYGNGEWSGRQTDSVF